MKRSSQNTNRLATHIEVAAGTRDKPLRTSVGEANIEVEHKVVKQSSQIAINLHFICNVEQTK